MVTSKLTPKQNAFAQNVASGMSLSDAYRNSYNAERMKPATIRHEASLLMADPIVTTTVERLQAAQERAVIASSLSDRERVLTKLRSAMEGDDSTSVQLRAAELLGKSIGLFKDVVETKQVRSSEEIKAELDALLEAAEAKAAVH